MRTIIFSLAFFITTFSNLSLAGNICVPEEKGVYVVLNNDANDPIAKMLKHAVENVWINTKYTFISEAEFEKDYKNKQGIDFMRYMEVELYGSGNEKSFGSQITMFQFKIDVEGKYGKKGVMCMDYYGWPAGFRITYKEFSGNGKKLKTDMRYDISQSDITFVVQRYHNRFENPAPYNGDYSDLGITTAAGANKKANGVIHKKTLVISKTIAEFFDITEEKMKKQYDYPCKVVSDEELDSYIDKKDPSIVYIRTRCYKGTENGKPLTYGNTDIPYVFVVDAATGFIFYTDENIQKSFVKAYIFRTLNK